MITIEGTWFDGQTSKGELIELSISTTGVVWFSNDLPATGFQHLTLSPQIGQTPRYIRLPNYTGHIETSALKTLSELETKYCPNRFNQLVHLFEQGWRTAVIAVLLTVVSSWLFIQYGVPKLSEYVASIVPQPIADEMGAETLLVLDYQFLSPTKLSEAKQAELTTLFEQYLPTDSVATYTLHFRAAPLIGANAFALPSGDIIVTDELVALAKNNQEILSVLLHEMGHVEHRHSLRSVTQNSLIGLFAMAFTGDATGVSSLASALPVVLLHSSFSREMETEADTYALDQMLQKDLDPQLFADIMTKLTDTSRETDDDSVLDYFSSHPVTSERISRFKQASHTP